MNVSDRGTEKARSDSLRLARKTASDAKRAAAAIKKFSRKSKKSGATKGAGTYSAVGKTVALLMKRHKGSSRGDGYSEGQEGAEFVCTNALGQNALERLQEWRIEERKHPGVRPDRLITHISLSRPAGAELDLAVWRDQVLPVFLEEAGIKGLYTSTLHSNTKNRHVHIVFSRSQPDGSLWDDSNDFWTLRAASQRAVKRLCIEVEGHPSNSQAPTDRAVNARRRALRRGTQPNVWVKPELVNSVLLQARSIDEFTTLLSAQGIDFKLSTSSTGQVTGALMRSAGAAEWLAGSSINRLFSLRSIQRQIEFNSTRTAGVMPPTPPAPMPGMRPVPPPPHLPRQRGG